MCLNSQNQNMGNSNKGLYRVEQILSPEWVPLSRETYCTLLKNLETQKEAEQYLITCENDVHHEIPIYDFRMTQRLNLVETLAVQRVTSNGLCNNTINLLVTNERIPKRLSEVSNLKVQEGISIVYACLVGYQAIFERVGYVEVNDEMIGFNCNKRVKVWLNQNFSQNKPSHIYKDSKATGTASVMIKEIVQTVMAHCSPSSESFNSFISTKIGSKSTFSESISWLEEYLKISNLKIHLKLTLEPEITTHQPLLPPKYLGMSAEGTTVLTSEVFPINISEPNIINRNINKFPIKAESRCTPSQSPMKTLTRIKSDPHLVRVHSITKSISSGTIERNERLVSPFNLLTRHQPMKANHTTTTIKHSPSLAKLPRIIQHSNNIRFGSPEQFQQLPNPPIARQAPIEMKAQRYPLVWPERENPEWTALKSPIKIVMGAEESKTPSTVQVSQQTSSASLCQIPLSSSSNFKKRASTTIPSKGESLQDSGCFQIGKSFGELNPIFDVTENESSQENRFPPEIPLIPLSFLHTQDESRETILQLKKSSDGISGNKFPASSSSLSFSNFLPVSVEFQAIRSQLKPKEVSSKSSQNGSQICEDKENIQQQKRTIGVSQFPLLDRKVQETVQSVYKDTNRMESSCGSFDSYHSSIFKSSKTLNMSVKENLNPRGRELGINKKLSYKDLKQTLYM